MAQCRMVWCPVVYQGAGNIPAGLDRRNENCLRRRFWGKARRKNHRKDEMSGAKAEQVEKVSGR